MGATINKVLQRSAWCLVALVLISHVLTISRSFPPWEDEVFAVSTSLSLARSHLQILSVLDQYPHTGSPLNFYGPVSFEVGAALIRLFGLSLAAWRLTCFAGVLLTLIASVLLVRVMHGDLWAQTLTALLLTLAGSTATYLPGRWDFVAVGLVLFFLLFLVRGAQEYRWAAYWRAVTAGVFLGLALSSTPRVLTLIVATSVGILCTMLFHNEVRKGLAIASALAFTVAFLTQSLVLAPFGLTPLRWLGFTRAASKGDPINAGPLLGGHQWGFGMEHNKAAFLILVFLVVILITGIRANFLVKSMDDARPWRMLLSTAGGVNLILMAALLSHILGSNAYWMPLLVIAGLGWVDLNLLRVRKLVGIVLGSAALVVAVLFVQEAQHVTAIAFSWARRDPKALYVFVKQNIPEGSAVYGPVGGYFYPVELAGSRYLYYKEQTTPGLVSEPDAAVAEKVQEEVCSRSTYVIWPSDDPLYYAHREPMPSPLRSHVASRVAELVEPLLLPSQSKILRKVGAVGEKYGYANLAVYRLRPVTPCLDRSSSQSGLVSPRRVPVAVAHP